MRLLALLLLSTLAASFAHAQSASSPATEASASRSDLVAALDRAMRETSDDHRVTRRGEGIQIRRESGESCVVFIPITEATRVRAQGVNLLRFEVPGIRWEDCASGGTYPATRFHFRESRDRDAALTAAQALLRGWNGTPRPASPTPLASGQRTERGQLDSSDEALSSGHRIDRYTVEVGAGNDLTVDLRSSDFDTYLVLSPPSGDNLTNDDWNGSRSHSRIEVDVTVSGIWEIRVRGYVQSATGAYDLTIDTADAP